MATGDLIVTGTQLGVGTTDKLSTLTVQARASFTLTGTVAIVSDSLTLTGTGTAFLSELVVGDRINLPDTGSFDQFRTVIAITSDTVLTVERPWVNPDSGVEAIALPSAIRVDNAATPPVPRFVVNDDGNVGVGTAAPQAILDVTGAGAGSFYYCPIGLRVYLPQESDGWSMVMVTDGENNTTPGVAFWVSQLQDDGGATLTFSVYDGVNNMHQDIVKIDGNGLHLATGFHAHSQGVSSSYTVEPEIHLLNADAQAAPFTITMPAIGSEDGRMIMIYKTDSSANAVTVAPPAGGTINGQTTSKTITQQYYGIQLTAMAGTWVASGLTPA